MSTVTRPELSEKNKYYLEKHRYYELKHFCLQYSTWKKNFNAIQGYSKQPNSLIFTSEPSNPTEKAVMERLYYYERMHMVERVCDQTAIDISQYLLKAVTEGYSYEYLRTTLGIPCCRESYYDAYRRFFYILNCVRN